MSEAVGDLFPFDEECELSRDWDITLTFSDGAPLKGYSQHLKQASAILKKALEHCKHDGTLDVGDDSREAWVLMLNLIHPGRHVQYPDLKGQSDLPDMERYAGLARKYSVQCMLKYISCGLCRILDDEKARVPVTLHDSDLERFFSKDGQVFGCCRIASTFGLKETERVRLSYFDQLFQTMAGRLRWYPKERQQMSDTIADFVSQLSSEGDYRFPFKIAEKALRLLGS